MSANFGGAKVTISSASQNARQWRAKARKHPLQADEAARQGKVSHHAFLALGKEGALAFLNDFSERLDGRPLAIATASADGEHLVLREIDRLAVLEHQPGTIPRRIAQ